VDAHSEGRSGGYGVVAKPLSHPTGRRDRSREAVIAGLDVARC